MNNNKVVLVTGGGTGGHLMPAIALCELLKENNFEPILITDSRCKIYLPQKLDFECIIIDIVRGNNLKNFFLFFYSLIKSTYSLIKLILSKNIVLTIGCGGYSSLPVLLSSILTRTKLILHEQNAYLGKVNYWFSYFSSRLFISFMHTINLPILDSERIIWTGIPLAKKHIYNNSRNNKNSDEVTIVVTGGSQGAEFFDELVYRSIVNIIEKNKNLKITLIQQSRNADNNILRNKYKSLGVNYKIEKFFNDIELYYSKCDIFIGRSGASTINEIIYYNIPSILIPYPYAKDDHQTHNAVNLVNFDAAKMINQSDVDYEKLSYLITEIIYDEKLIVKMRKLLEKLKINTSEIIVSEVKKILNK